MNFLGKFSPSLAEVYEPLMKLISPKCKWTWNNTYQNIFGMAKNIIKNNAVMAFYNEKEQLQLETEAPVLI